MKQIRELIDKLSINDMCVSGDYQLAGCGTISLHPRLEGVLQHQLSVAALFDNRISLRLGATELVHSSAALCVSAPLQHRLAEPEINQSRARNKSKQSPK